MLIALATGCDNRIRDPWTRWCAAPPVPAEQRPRYSHPDPLPGVPSCEGENDLLTQYHDGTSAIVRYRKTASCCEVARCEAAAGEDIFKKCANPWPDLTPTASTIAPTEIANDPHPSSATLAAPRALLHDPEKPGLLYGREPAALAAEYLGFCARLASDDWCAVERKQYLQGCVAGAFYMLSVQEPDLALKEYLLNGAREMAAEWRAERSDSPMWADTALCVGPNL